jgi:hypothetical protein
MDRSEFQKRAAKQTLDHYQKQIEWFRKSMVIIIKQNQEIEEINSKNCHPSCR